MIVVQVLHGVLDLVRQLDHLRGDAITGLSLPGKSHLSDYLQTAERVVHVVDSSLHPHQYTRVHLPVKLL